MGCGTRTVKSFMIATNVLFLLSGIALIALGAYIRVEDNDYNDVFGKGGPFAPANILLAVGVLIFIISFMGCCGAIKENKCMLCLFVVFMVIILLCETVCIVLAFVYRSEAKRYATDAITEAIKNTYEETGQAGVTKAVNNIQKNFKCCGANNYTDWMGSKWAAKNPLFRVPKSCCSTTNYDDCQNSTAPVSDIFTKSCAKELEDWAMNNLAIIGGIGCGVIVIELLGILFAVIIMNHGDSVHIA